jgi:nucleoside-diphosphate-sugar epimerase
MPRKVLVTGGAGFIGSALVRSLREAGDAVVVLDNFSTGHRANLDEVARSIELIEGDIRDLTVLERAMTGVEIVFHQAAIPSVPRSLVDPIGSHAANATGTLSVLESARRQGVRRVVYAGSSSAYGNTAVLPKVESMPAAPLSPYAVSKLAGELYCQMYAATLGVETVVLRYFNVFGPRQDPASEYAAVIPRFVTAAIERRVAVVFGDGTQSRDFCYVDNAVEANVKAAIAPGVSGRVFNVACGSATDLNSVLRLVGELVGRPVEARHQPSRLGDVKHSLADITEARTRLGYTAAVSFGEGLRRTVDWFLQRSQP